MKPVASCSWLFHFLHLTTDLFENIQVAKKLQVTGRPHRENHDGAGDSDFYLPRCSYLDRPMDPAGSAGSLPPETWLYIYRLATSDASPLALCNADRFQYFCITDPLKDVEHFWRDAYSFALVCKLWNSIATELLYENIRVDDRFDALCTSLRRPGHGVLVRSVRLSPTRLDQNCIILPLCPRLQVIVKPPATREDVVQFRTLNGDNDTALSHRLPFHLWKMPFQFLKHIYWAPTPLDSALLYNLIWVAPHIEYMFLSSSTVSATGSEACAFSPFGNLQHIKFVSASASLTGSILKAPQHNFTRLNCSPAIFTLADAPVFPTLSVLELLGSHSTRHSRALGGADSSRSTIPFAAIFSCCPRLRELCYDVWNGLSALGPRSEHPPPPLSCIRLHSAATIVQDWSSFQRHFRLFVAPDFPRFKRLVLHGNWHSVIDMPTGVNTLTPFLNNLRAQGCQVEFPEGCLL
ncbi:hypothetical protein MVEN_02328200 [Mycena venus]|uniref:F-box domain-containing protein n=1 Tax=Mycena venus TaxID=2733690 RepID=A0A8H7CFN2_9AGAR|nr:hypothetical protein MVEN_02328200 [Mycena venus]